MKKDLRQVIDTIPEENRFTEIKYMEFLSCRKKFLNIAERIFISTSPPARILIIEYNGSFLSMVINKFGFCVDHKALRKEHLTFGDNGDFCLTQELHNDYEMLFRDFPENSYDAIIMVNIMEHLYIDPLKVLQKVSYFAKTGGHIMITTNNVARLGARVRLLSGRNIYPSYKDYYDNKGTLNQSAILRQYNLQELKELTSSAGYTVIKSGFMIDRPPVDPYRGITFVRYIGSYFYYFLKKIIPPLRDAIFLIAKKT
jgi:SAM-dependent methyltransferase